MAIIITKHAEQRLLQRTLIQKKDLPELVKKAWKSPAPKGKILAHCRAGEGLSPEKIYIYRKFNGFVYVFAEDAPDIILVTAYYYTYTPRPKRLFLSLQAYAGLIDEKTKRRIKFESKRNGTYGQSRAFKKNQKFMER